MHNDETLTKVFNGHEIRIVERDGDAWLVGRDVTNALTLHRSQLRRLDDDEKGVHEIHTPGGPQEMVVINEPGAYRLVFSSQKHEAQQFKRWLSHDVIPEIRRTGLYSGDGAPAGDLSTLDAVEGMVKALRQQQERLRDVEAQQAENTERLADVEQSLEEHRAAPDSPTTRYGHEVKSYTWDGMRTTVNRMVRRYQQTHGGGYSQLYRRLYRQCQKEYGFHPKRVQRHEGGSSGIKALDFDQMRALLQVSRWIYSEEHTPKV